MSGRAFLDTNVLVYLYDTDAPGKQEAARRALAPADDSDLVISTQVIQEFYATVTKKFAKRLAHPEILLALRGLRRLPTVQVDVPIIFEAIEVARRFKISFWDGLIVQAALSAGCARLLTEDLQHGLRIGSLTVENPFLELRN